MGRRCARLNFPSSGSVKLVGPQAKKHYPFASGTSFRDLSLTDIGTPFTSNNTTYNPTRAKEEVGNKKENVLPKLL